MIIDKPTYQDLKKKALDGDPEHVFLKQIDAGVTYAPGGSIGYTAPVAQYMLDGKPANLISIKSVNNENSLDRGHILFWLNCCGNKFSNPDHTRSWSSFDAIRGLPKDTLCIIYIVYGPSYLKTVGPLVFDDKTISLIDSLRTFMLGGTSRLSEDQLQIFLEAVQSEPMLTDEKQLMFVHNTLMEMIGIDTRKKLFPLEENSVKSQTIQELVDQLPPSIFAAKKKWAGRSKKIPA